MKRKRLIYGGVVFTLVLIIYFSFRPTKFVEMNCYEERSLEKGHVTRVYLVKSLPWTHSKFEEEVRNKLKTIKRRSGSNSESIYFVKEVSNNIINRFLWGDDNSYEDCSTELNSAEFLAEAFYFKTLNGRDTMRLKIYSGDLYHY